MRVHVAERPILDTAAAAVLVIVHWRLVERWFDPWSKMNAQERFGLFGTGGTVVAIVAGFAAVGISVGGLGDRGRELRRLYGPELRRNRRALLIMGALSSLCCLVAYGATANGEDWAPYLFEFALVWTVLRMVRLAWLIDTLMALDDVDISDPGRPGPQPLSEEFQRRMKAS